MNFIKILKKLGGIQETWKKIYCNYRKISQNLVTFQKNVLEITYKLWRN